ncbi:MAG: hypothetical protein WCI05_02130 [Myxococcales bacterium]|jgi:hypothetical protein
MSHERHASLRSDHSGRARSDHRDFSASPKRSSEGDAERARVSVQAHRAALEALFAPKPTATPPPPKRETAKMVIARAADPDPQELHRGKLYDRLLGAQGRLAISKASDEYVRAGFLLPREQEVHVQLLEHTDEERVRGSITALTELLGAESPKRRTVLESRLRRIEECAEEPTTRDLAAGLRRRLR